MDSALSYRTVVRVNEYLPIVETETLSVSL